VISPYSKPGVVDSYYTQLDMVKTIEQILAIPPMNQEDAAAEPMYDAFTQHPDDAPYTLQPNEIPLNLGAPTSLTSPAAGMTSAERQAFRPQGVVPSDMRSVYDAWMAWQKQQAADNGSMSRADREKPVLLNRFDWYSAHSWTVAYPGDPKIDTPNEVPGRNLPAAFLGDS